MMHDSEGRGLDRPQEVDTHYREVALGQRTGQCAFDLHGSGYSKEDLAAVPASLCSMSRGCGNVSVLGGLAEGWTVVDVGSGAGLDLFLARRRVGPSGKVIGVEPLAEMRAVCQRFIDESGLQNVEVRPGDSGSLPVESGSVDCVISNCVFALVNDPGGLAEIARVLKSGARFVFSDIFVRSPFLWVLLAIRALAGRRAPMLRSLQLSRRRRIATLRAAGFTNVEVLAASGFTSAEVGELLVETGLPGFLAGLGKLMLYRSEVAATKANG